MALSPTVMCSSPGWRRHHLRLITTEAACEQKAAVPTANHCLRRRLSTTKPSQQKQPTEGACHDVTARALACRSAGYRRWRAEDDEYVGLRGLQGAIDSLARLGIEDLLPALPRGQVSQKRRVGAFHLVEALDDLLCTRRLDQLPGQRLVALYSTHLVRRPRWTRSPNPPETANQRASSAVRRAAAAWWRGSSLLSRC